MLTTKFLLAGDATFTIETPDKGHRTYRMTRVEPDGVRFRDPAWFCRLLTGPNNESDFDAYLGKLDPFAGQVVPTAKVDRDVVESFPFRLLNRVLARVWSDDCAAFEQHGYKLHHEGMCGRCGRKLTDPVSIEVGLGPVCRGDMGKPDAVLLKGGA